MTRIEFLDRLCKGLKGLPPSTLKEIMADYEAHFKDAAEAGRGGHPSHDNGRRLPARRHRRDLRLGRARQDERERGRDRREHPPTGPLHPWP